MQKLEILVFEESDMVRGTMNVKSSIGGDRLLWMANQAILRKRDGTVEVLKDRWATPVNRCTIEIGIPNDV
jgi:hypothetical protein